MKAKVTKSVGWRPQSTCSYDRRQKATRLLRSSLYSLDGYKSHGHSDLIDKFFDGEWVRKATAMEVKSDEEHLKGRLLVWCQMDLSSKEPLQEEQVKTALEHLYRKCPNLAVCYGNRDGETWFRRATNPNVDFKVHHGMSLVEMRTLLKSYHYSSSTGPLFCGRLMINSPEPNEGLVDLDPSFPSKSRMMFGFHHGVGDGTTIAMVIGFFISLLNDVIGHRPIGDKEPLGIWLSDEETQRLILEKKELLEKDEELQLKLSETYKRIKESTLLFDEVFLKTKEDNQTDSIVRILDQSSTVKFIQRCRQEKVTVTSAIAAIVNMAFVDIAVQQGFIKDVYTITNAHIIDLRRYWKCQVFGTTGLHRELPLLFFTETPRDVRDIFWSYVKNIGITFKDDVVSGRFFADKAYELLASEQGTDPESIFHMSSDYHSDYLTSSNGDMTSKVTEGGDLVKVTNVIYGTSINSDPCHTLVSCHTFRNVFSIIFEYDRAIINSTVAEALANQIVHNIHESVAEEK